MKTKKEYICPTIEILSTEMPLVCWSLNKKPSEKDDGDPKPVIEEGDELNARQNSFTFTDDW